VDVQHLVIKRWMESAMSATIKRITLYRLRIPIPREAVNCGAFSHETLQRGATGLPDGPWFGDAPILVARVEGAGESGWGDLSRGADITQCGLIAQRLIGTSCQDVRPDIDDCAGVRVPRGLHSAMLDWAARVKGVPLHAMFGQRVRAGIKVAHWSGHRTPVGAAELAVKARAEGIQSLKLKSSFKADDAGVARAVRDAAPGFELVIDPNGRWETFEVAVERARTIRSLNENVWLEDPLYNSDLLLAQIVKQSGIALVKTVIGDVGVVKGMSAMPSAFNLVGSWPDLLRGSTVVEARGLRFWTGSAVDTGLFDLATIHFGVTQPAFTMSAELAGSQVREHSLLSRSIEIRQGVASPPDGPGLGIPVDMDAIRKYQLGDPHVVE
jgi:muconate cycloisomerase